MIYWYSADTQTLAIIAYGEINRKKVAKITYSDGIYFGYILKKRQYEYVGQGSSLKVAQNFCQISI